MKRTLFLALFLNLLVFSFDVQAQRNRPRAKSKPATTTTNTQGNKAIVIDRNLSVLRVRPSLYAIPEQRLSVGREVTVIGEKEADGVTFYRVRVSKNTTGWVQSEAVVGSFRKNDDQRLVKLIQASDGFDQIDKIMIFLTHFPKSELRPAILLQLGDLMEEEALRISKNAAKALDRREMAASGAPLHSFYLNYTSLDRYGKIGVGFLFNSSTKSLHYNGDAWFEIVQKFPNSSEAEEAQKRIDTLKEKMEAK